MSLKNPNDTIGNRTRYLPVCSVVFYPLRHRSPLTPMLLFLLICKWTTCKLTLSHSALQFQWSKRKQILTTERAIREDKRRLLPRNTDLHQGKRWTELTRIIWTFGTIWCFLLPKTPKVSYHWGMNSFLFWVACLAVSINLQTTSALYCKCACSSEHLGAIAKRISDL